MPIPVKLSEIVDEMSMSGDEISTYLNRVTGEFVTATAEAKTGCRGPGGLGPSSGLATKGDAQDQGGPRVRRLSQPARGVRDPRVVDHGAVRLLRGPTKKRVTSCLAVLHGPRRIPYFKDTVRRLCIQQDWYRFRDQAFRKIARDWLCGPNSIPFVE